MHFFDGQTDLLDVDEVLDFLHVSRLRLNKPISKIIVHGLVLFVWEEVVHLVVHFYNQL